MFVQPPQPPRQKIPKDGPGPRGVPDCYYTSRVLNSTFRYAKFVKKLRALEEEQRKGEENKLKELKDTQYNDFFIHCDRRSLINNVARRVDLCFASYLEDLKQKRTRLIDLLTVEEEANIRKFVEQAQAGAEAVWQEKKNRLKYLLEKRKKEIEEKYKDTALSKCVDVLTHIFKLRAKEAQEIQLYQIKEKEAMKLAEKEFDKMWHEVAMKEADALAARMEQDAIERRRRDIECKQYTDHQLEQKKIQREKEREKLKEETLWLKSVWEADIKKEQEAEAERAEKRKKMALERKQMIIERQEVVEKQNTANQVIGDTWASLAGEGRANELAEVELMKRKKRELNECNRKMIELKEELLKAETACDGLFAEDARQKQDYIDKKRCEYLIWSQKTNREVRKAMVDQIKDRAEARDALKKKLAEENEYHRLLFSQLQQLYDQEQLAEAQKRKRHQNELLVQIECSKLLKEKAKQEEMDQIRKCQLATEECQKEIQKILSRPFFTNDVHPFMKQMAKGLHMKEKCPCSRPDYCGICK